MEPASARPSDNEPDALFKNALAKAANRELDVGALIAISTQIAAAAPAMAATLYKTWIAGNATYPGLPGIYFNYAVCLTDCDDLHGAVNALRETIRLKPDFEPPHINLGMLLERLGQPGPAVEAWLNFVATLPQVTPGAIKHKLLALKQIGRVLELAQKDSAAEDALRQSLELDGTQSDVAQHLVALRQRQCKWPALDTVGDIPADKLRAAMSPLSAACYTDDPLFHLGLAYNYARRTIGLPPKNRAPRLEAVATHHPDHRLRIGYMSSDLREHAVGFAMTDVIESHDRNRVEIFAYYCGIAAADPTHHRTRQAADHWTDLTGLDDAQAAQAIRRDEIDILVDLNGYTKDARTKIFAMRPAPIAVNWFGFPGSMGSPYHHYIIADAHIIPPEYERYYSEKVLRLPCYQPNDRFRLVAPNTPAREQAGLPAGAFVFCSMNGLQKLTPATFTRWTAILHQTPGSVLWLLGGTPETNDRLRTAAETAGIDPARLIFAEKTGNPDHLARLPLADLFLDTFPYGAHTTASDALWMGVPVLTLKGRSFASRVCASLVRAAGIPEMVCTDPQDYVARAVHLANNRAQLSHIQHRLKAARPHCTLFDTPNLVRSLESLYVRMHQDRRNGALPQPDLTNLEIYHELAAAEDLEGAETLDDTAYLNQYRERLRDLDSTFPIPQDQRLWDGRH